MAKNAKLVKMGVCDASFDGADLGYTHGGVSVSFSTESTQIVCDQEDVPIAEKLNKMQFEAKIPMAEYDLARFEKILPGSQLIVDATDPNKKKLVITGESGTNLLDMAGELILTPAGGDANDVITLHTAIPVPSMEFAYEKENQRVFEVTFKAMKGEGGFVTMGDVSATSA